ERKRSTAPPWKNHGLLPSRATQVQLQSPLQTRINISGAAEYFLRSREDHQDVFCIKAKPHPNHRGTLCGQDPPMEPSGPQPTNRARSQEYPT
ncbi:hypothetical protein AMECASPLE_024183, partial [Ameca splendens]